MLFSSMTDLFDVWSTYQMHICVASWFIWTLQPFWLSEIYCLSRRQMKKYICMQNYVNRLVLIVLRFWIIILAATNQFPWIQLLTVFFLNLSNDVMYGAYHKVIRFRKLVSIVYGTLLLLDCLLRYCQDVDDSALTSDPHVQLLLCYYFWDLMRDLSYCITFSHKYDKNLIFLKMFFMLTYYVVHIGTVLNFFPLLVLLCLFIR